MLPSHQSVECPINVEGLSIEGVSTDKHPMWFPPNETTNNRIDRLRVSNSLTETIEPFVPRKGRNVSWYVCGPTVYDSAHMGHARAYLTFDIMRRIMQGYFRFNVIYQMNITDIDDKIIKKARIDLLLNEYADRLNQSDSATVDAEITSALEAYITKIKEDKESTLQQLEGSTSKRVKEECEDKLKGLSLKNDRANQAQQRVLEIRHTAFATVNEKNHTLLDTCKDIMGDWLDSKNQGRTYSHEIFENHARKYESEFMEDMALLNVLPPDLVSRVTECLPQIIAFIQHIIDQRMAYISSSSVFFDLKAYMQKGHAYPKLKPIACAIDRMTSAAEMKESEGEMFSAKGINEKRSPNDFALWKFSKPGEPSWDSPWGRGRPGWHIECSAMASDFLGANIDIHGGGWDLKFPHHDNEIAQSEAYWNNNQWVNYFFHCGHLHIRGLKMAKSLKNFSTIRETLTDCSANVVRMVFLLQQWNKPMNFSSQVIIEGKEKLRVVTNFLGNIEAIIRHDHLYKHQNLGEAEKNLYELVMKLNTEIHSALCDNFNTPKCIESIFEVISAGNKYLQTTVNNATPLTSPNTSLLRRLEVEVRTPLEIFGLKNLTDDSFRASGNSGKTEDILDVFVSFRDNVRDIAKKEKIKSLFSICDVVRDDQLPSLGVRLEDATNRASRWRYQNPEEIVNEVRARNVEKERNGNI